MAQAKAIVAELKKYDPELYAKPRWLVLNKLDMVPEEERQERVANFVKRLRWKGSVFEISALTHAGCEVLTQTIHQYLQSQRLLLEEAGQADPRFADPVEKI